MGWGSSAGSKFGGLSCMVLGYGIPGGDRRTFVVRVGVS